MKLLNFLLILIITLVGCAQSSNNEMYDILANTEVLRNPVVVDQSKDAFRISYSTWKNKSLLNYFIYYPPVVKDGKTVTDYFNDLDKQYISGLTAQAADEWKPHVNMHVKETSNITHADFDGMKAGGGSAVAYAWFIWEKGFEGQTTIEWFN